MIIFKTFLRRLRNSSQQVEINTWTMNLGSIRKTAIKSAQAKLAQHKTLGQQSTLSIMQVAELLDIVSGKTEVTTAYTNIFFDNTTFSLN